MSDSIDRDELYRLQPLQPRILLSAADIEVDPEVLDSTPAIDSPAEVADDSGSENVDPVYIRCPVVDGEEAPEDVIMYTMGAVEGEGEPNILFPLNPDASPEDLAAQSGMAEEGEVTTTSVDEAPLDNPTDTAPDGILYMMGGPATAPQAQPDEQPAAEPGGAAVVAPQAAQAAPAAQVNPVLSKPDDLLASDGEVLS